MLYELEKDTFSVDNEGANTEKVDNNVHIYVIVNTKEYSDKSFGIIKVATDDFTELHAYGWDLDKDLNVGEFKDDCGGTYGNTTSIIRIA